MGPAIDPHVPACKKRGDMTETATVDRNAQAVSTLKGLALKYTSPPVLVSGGVMHCELPGLGTVWLEIGREGSPLDPNPDTNPDDFVPVGPFGVLVNCDDKDVVMRVVAQIINDVDRIWDQSDAWQMAGNICGNNLAVLAERIRLAAFLEQFHSRAVMPGVQTVTSIHRYPAGRPFP